MIVPFVAFLRAVARANVRDFMRHDARKLRFFVGAQYQSAIHVEESARESKRVDGVRIDDLDGEGNLRVRIPDQILSNSIYVFGDDGIGDELRNAIDFLRELLAERNFMLHRVHVEAMPDLAIADRIDVGFAPALDARRRRAGILSLRRVLSWSSVRWRSRLRLLRLRLRRLRSLRGRSLGLLLLSVCRRVNESHCQQNRCKLSHPGFHGAPPANIDVIIHPNVR